MNQLFGDQVIDVSEVKVGKFVLPQPTYFIHCFGEKAQLWFPNDYRNTQRVHCDLSLGFDDTCAPVTFHYVTILIIEFDSMAYFT